MTALGATAVPLVALAVAGCGNGASNASATTPRKTPHKASTAHVVAVRAAKTRLGRILVDSHGRTLYLFKGASGTGSAPTSAFAAWPPLRVSGTPTAGAGAKTSLVGTAKDAGGQTVVTYHRHPLYTFIKDHKRGDTAGEGVTAFGGTWLVVSPAGKAIAPRRAHARPAKSAAPPAASSATPTPTPTATPRPAAPTSTPRPHNGIPQNGGGDGDADNNGGPDDGDGGI